MARTALITGITGQDGAYLARLLLERGYTVIGGTRRDGATATWRLGELGIADAVRLVPLDMLDATSLRHAIDHYAPDEVYNFAAQSSVHASFEEPVHSAEVNGIGAARLLECLRLAGKGARFYQASTSEMIGPGADGPQDENAVFLPRSPYAAGKLFAHHLVATYRQGYGLFACSGITFNHESPLRPPEFVTRKITIGLARLKLGLQPVLELGNVDAERDWGHAADYVQAIWLMLQQDEARDYVLATGRTNSVRTFVDLAAAALGVSLDWEGEGLTARARERKTGRVWVRVDPAFMRPIDLPRVSGNPRRAEDELGWSRSYDLPALVEEMAARDYDRVTGGQAAMPAGPLAARS